MITIRPGAEFKPVEPGTYVARCYQIFELGTQPGGQYDPARKVHIGWEIPDELIEFVDNSGQRQRRPAVISKEYTASTGKKATLRAHLEGWRGQVFTPEEIAGFQLNKVIGIPALLTVSAYTKMDGGTGSKISGVSKLMKGQVCPTAVHKPVIYELAMGNNDVFKSLPEWIQKKLFAAAEWEHQPKVSIGQDAETPSSEDDVPF